MATVRGIDSIVKKLGDLDVSKVEPSKLANNLIGALDRVDRSEKPAAEAPSKGFIGSARFLPNVEDVRESNIERLACGVADVIGCLWNNPKMADRAACITAGLIKGISKEGK